MNSRAHLQSSSITSFIRGLQRIFQIHQFRKRSHLFFRVNFSVSFRTLILNVFQMNFVEDFSPGKE